LLLITVFHNEAQDNNNQSTTKHINLILIGLGVKGLKNAIV